MWLKHSSCTKKNIKLHILFTLIAKRSNGCPSGGRQKYWSCSRFAEGCSHVWKGRSTACKGQGILKNVYLCKLSLERAIFEILSTSGPWILNSSTSVNFFLSKLAGSWYVIRMWRAADLTHWKYNLLHANLIIYLSL